MKSWTMSISGVSLIVSIICFMWAWAKLTVEQVRAMRVRQATGETMGALAREYGVNVGTVHSLVRRRMWKHVE